MENELSIISPETPISNTDVSKLVGSNKDADILTELALSGDYSTPIARTFVDRDIWYVRNITQGKSQKPEVCRLFGIGQYCTEKQWEFAQEVEKTFSELNSKMREAAKKRGRPVKTKEQPNPLGLRTIEA